MTGETREWAAAQRAAGRLVFAEWGLTFAFENDDERQDIEVYAMKVRLRRAAQRAGQDSRPGVWSRTGRRHVDERLHRIALEIRRPRSYSNPDFSRSRRTQLIPRLCRFSLPRSTGLSDHVRSAAICR